MTRPHLTGLLTITTLVALTFLFFWKILLTNLILVGVDTLLYFYPYKAYTAEVLRQGRLPLWNPHLFMGAPLLANSQVGLFYPFNWLFLWLDPPKQVAWSIGLHIVLAGSLMLAYVRLSLRLSWLGAMIAAILFAFGGYLGAQVEHINQLNAAAWLPLLFLLYDFGIQRERRWLWFLLLALVIAITLLAGHAQTVFISLFGLGMYGLWRATASAHQRISAWRTHRAAKPVTNERMTNEEAIAAQLADPIQQTTPNQTSSSSSTIHNSQFTIHNSQLIFRFLASSLLHYLLPLAVVSVLAVALAAIQLLPTAELSALSIRSGGLTFRETVSFSLRPTNLHYALLPPFGLDLSQVLGEAFGEWVAYVGVSGLILALLGGLCAIWRTEARRFVFLAGSGLVLSLGLFSGPLYLVLYYLVPGFGLFRVPARWLLLYAFGIAVLAGFGLEALLAPSQSREHLASTWRWLRARWWRVGFFVGLPVALLLSLIAWKTPPVITLTAWLVLAVITFYILRFTFYATAHRGPLALRSLPLGRTRAKPPLGTHYASRFSAQPPFGTLQSEASPWDASRFTLSSLIDSLVHHRSLRRSYCFRPTPTHVRIYYPLPPRRSFLPGCLRRFTPQRVHLNSISRLFWWFTGIRRYCFIGVDRSSSHHNLKSPIPQGHDVSTPVRQAVQYPKGTMSPISGYFLLGWRRAGEFIAGFWWQHLFISPLLSLDSWF
jgi:hypothetical protein